MRRFSTIATMALVTMIGFTPVFAADFMPPEWRGLEGTTMQSWEFSTNANPALPDIDQNPYGDATADIEYSTPFVPWIDVDGQAPFTHQGVWYIEDWIEFGIPNNPEPNDYKEVWVQLTFYADGGGDPQFFTDPTMQGAAAEIYKEPVADGDAYYHAVYSIMFDHNPDYETVWLMPRDCTIYVDSIVIDTICAPEPATAALLFVPALAMLRRRR